MGNKLSASLDQRVSIFGKFHKVKRRSSSFRHLVSPSSPLLHQPHHQNQKRRSRSQSEGVTSDCGTVISTTDSQLPRGSGFSDKAGDDMTLLLPLDPTKEEDEQSRSVRDNCNSKPSSEHAADQIRRIREAEKILLEIAKEYGAKRAAGLVPTKPVPARTLLWEEMERRTQRIRAGIGRRGTCVYGRDSSEGPCGCSNYKRMKKLVNGLENTGGICECCKHGAPWHRLAGGTMATTGSCSMSMSMTRVSIRSRGARSRASSRNSHTVSRTGSIRQQTPIDGSMYSLGSDYYDEYDDEYDSDETSDDDEDIANEVARPAGLIGDPTPPLSQTQYSHARSEGDARDRSSLFSNGDSFGLPPCLSSTSRHLDKLLGAIAKYRGMGLSEDMIEIKIREDFLPARRLSLSGDNLNRASH